MKMGKGLDLLLLLWIVVAIAAFLVIRSIQILGFYA